MSRPIPRDCLTPVAAALFGALLLVAGLVAFQIPERPWNHPASVHSLIASTGEWVTRPDGRKVCRLSRNIYRYEVLPASGWCEEWREPAPQYGQTVDGWIRSYLGSHQIMIEGEWRP